MRFIISFLFFIILESEYVHAQTAISNTEFIVQEGQFICKLNDLLIYSYTEDDGEYILYDLYSLDPITKNKILIDSLVTSNCWAKTSDSTLAYSKSGKLYSWNSETGKIASFLQSESFNEIVGLGFNRDLRKLIIFDFDYEKNLMQLTVFDNLNDNTFSRKIGVNENELEGIFPKIESVKGYIIFSIQDKLYILDLLKGTPELKLISDGCNGFALYEDKGVLFYKFISELKNAGSIIFYEGWETDVIDKSLDEKTFKCETLGPFTAQIDNKFMPVYVICNVPYGFWEFKWQALSDVVVYEDNKLIVRLSHAEANINEECFEWNLQYK